MSEVSVPVAGALLGTAAEAIAVGRATEATHAAEAGRAATRATTERATKTSADTTETLGLRRRTANQRRDNGRAHNQLIRFHVRISR